MDYTKTYDKGLIPVKKLPKDLAERFEDLRIFSKHMPVMERRFFIEKLVELERTYKEDTEIKTIKCFNHIVNRWQKSITLKELTETKNIQWQNLTFYLEQH